MFFCDRDSFLLRAPVLRHGISFLRLKDCHVAALLAMTQKWQVFHENLPFLFPNCLRFVAERHRHSVPPGRYTMRPRKDNAEGWIVLFKGTSDSIARVVSEGFCFQIEVWKLQESFTYFKIFKPISWGERPAERRRRSIQRFLNSPALGLHTIRVSTLWGTFFNEYPYLSTNPLKIQRVPISLTLTAAQTASAPTKHRTPRRRIALQRGSFMLWNGENLNFKQFSGIEKVHRNSIKITVNLWRSERDLNSRALFKRLLP